MQEGRQRRAEFSNVNNDPRRLSGSRQATAACYASIDRPEEGFLWIFYTVRIKGNGTKEQFAEVHKAVMATSPNFYNLSRPVVLKPALVIE